MPSTYHCKSCAHAHVKCFGAPKRSGEIEDARSCGSKLGREPNIPIAGAFVDEKTDKGFEGSRKWLRPVLAICLQEDGTMGTQKLGR